jgi:2-polyprenyl-6-methoxyphenol hydroxylase-like FAD-dependent oxidoreductase
MTGWVKEVDISGAGIAACGSARLLTQRGFSVCLQQASRVRPTRLLLSEQTQSLFREIFEAPELFAGAPRIRRRIVAWGENAQPLELPHSGIVFSEQELLNNLWERIRVPAPVPSPSGAAATTWTINSAQKSGSPARSQSFGARQASTARVKLAEQTPQDCCWIESLPNGWLFLLPCGEGHAILISTGYSPDGLIEESRLIVRHIATLEDVSGPHHFPAYPQILPELCGPLWLACGSAAMSFDPLCGEGAGHALREAVLAAAVIHGAAQGYSVETLVAHYNTRLMQGFLRHLQVCLPFYQRGGRSEFWEAEAAALANGIAWMHSRLQNHARVCYRLVGYDLEPITG